MASWLFFSFLCFTSSECELEGFLCWGWAWKGLLMKFKLEEWRYMYITIIRTSSSSRYQRLGFKGWAKCPVAPEICFVRNTENHSRYTMRIWTLILAFWKMMILFLSVFLFSRKMNMPTFVLHPEIKDALNENQVNSIIPEAIYKQMWVESIIAKVLFYYLYHDASVVF